MNLEGLRVRRDERPRSTDPRGQCANDRRQHTEQCRSPLPREAGRFAQIHRPVFPVLHVGEDRTDPSKLGEYLGGPPRNRFGRIGLHLAHVSILNVALGADGEKRRETNRCHVIEYEIRYLSVDPYSGVQGSRVEFSDNRVQLRYGLGWASVHRTLIGAPAR